MRYNCNMEKSKFYNSRLWRNKRKEILIRDNNECQLCKAFGGYKKANVVHHKKELEYFPSLALESDNLQSLCRECHEKIHNRVSKEDLNEEKW